MEVQDYYAAYQHYEQCAGYYAAKYEQAPVAPHQAVQTGYDAE